MGSDPIYMVLLYHNSQPVSGIVQTPGVAPGSPAFAVLSYVSYYLHMVGEVGFEPTKGLTN